MSVDNRITSSPYMELNGYTLYAEDSGCTRGEINMNKKEYDGLGTHGAINLKRINNLIDRLIVYMDEGDSITITGIADEKFNVVMNLNRAKKRKREVVDMETAFVGNESIDVHLQDGRVVSIENTEGLDV